MTNFKNQTVLITGATSGIGLACAERFAKAGARLVLIGRRKERLQALQKQWKQTHIAMLDVQNRKAVEKCIHALPSEFAKVDVLINSAGLALGLGKAQQASLDDWEQMVDTNIKGVLYMTRALLPGMVKRGRGHIINLGSIAGTYPYEGGNVYGATKSFIEQFTLNLKCDLLGTPVRVSNIEPGMVETEFSVVRFEGDKKKAASVYEGTTPMKAKDIAEIIFWVASQPQHVNINRVEVMATRQALAGYAIDRNDKKG